LVLASASPRRRDLLSLLGVPFEVSPVDIVEEAGDGARPELTARRLAREKAEAARLRLSGPAILAADTVVVHGGEILGKPRDAAQAEEMLRRLRGRWHEVVTGIALLPGGRTGALVRHAVSNVLIRYLTNEEIAESISRGDPFDKAGAYAIQDSVLMPAESYRGCYCNVVGLPLWPTIQMLARGDVPVSSVTADLLPQCGECPLRPSASE
jgi:MAF protein